MDVYCIAYHFKKTLIFAILMKNIQYKAKKEARYIINLKSIVF